MSSIRKRTLASGEVRHDVRYRDPSGVQRTKTFKRRVDARNFLKLNDADQLRGEWVDPDRARSVFVDVWVRRLHESKDLREKSKVREWTTITSQLDPRWKGFRCRP